VALEAFAGSRASAIVVDAREGCWGLDIGVRHLILEPRCCPDRPLLPSLVSCFRASTLCFHRRSFSNLLMSATQYTPDSLESLLKKLSLTDDDPDHEEILKHANNVLKSSKGNTHALHTKVVALLNLDRHEDALRVFTSNEGQKIADIAVLERAYCLYKVGKLHEAVELSQTAATNDLNGRALKHITAQAVSLSPNLSYK